LPPDETTSADRLGPDSTGLTVPIYRDNRRDFRATDVNGRVAPNVIP
jgi:hypothetical protein